MSERRLENIMFASLAGTLLIVGAGTVGLIGRWAAVIGFALLAISVYARFLLGFDETDTGQDQEVREP